MATDWKVFRSGVPSPSTRPSVARHPRTTCAVNEPGELLGREGKRDSRPGETAPAGGIAPCLSRARELDAGRGV